MKRRFFAYFNNLGTQLIGLYMLIIIPSLIVLFAFDYLAGSEIQTNVRANDLSLARAIALETDLAISKSMQGVSALAKTPAVINANEREMKNIFHIFLQTRPDVNLVYRLNKDGIMLYHYPEGPSSTVGRDFSFRDYYQDALLSQKALVSKGRISPTTNEAVATAVMPLYDGDTFQGIVAANLRLTNLSDTLKEIISSRREDENFEILILDSNAQIIAHPESTYLLQEAKTLLPDIYAPSLVGKSGVRVEIDHSREERLYTYAPIESAGWSVIVSRPTAKAFATQIAIHRITQIAAGTFIIFGLLIWLILARNVVMPIERLSALSQAIGSKQGLSKEERHKIKKLANRPDQIGYLIRSILRMEESIATRIHEQETLLETSKVVVSTLDPQIVLDRILQQVQKLFNVNMSAIVSLDEEQNIFRIRSSLGLSKKYAQQLTIQPNDPNSITMRALKAKEPIQISDTQTDPTFTTRLPRAELEGYRSLLAVPLKTQHTSPAALIVFRPDPHVFTKTEIDLLANFANHVTMAIENATLYARSDMRLQEQTRRIESLIHSLSDGLILSTIEGKVVYANRRIAKLAKLSDEELQNSTVDSAINHIIINASEPIKLRQKIDNVLSNEEENGVILPLNMPHHKIYLRLHVFDVTDDQGIAIGRGLIFRDITVDQEVDQMKSSLISTVSHELRTPLASIKGYATTLLADDVEWDTKSQREFLSIISDETDRLSNLVNSLLDLSRIESGNIKISLTACSTDELIERAAKRTRLSPSNTLVIKLDPNLPTLYADPPRIETVLRNLIENAVKYAGKRATIRVEVSEENQQILFRVKDNGPGIPEEESKKIFHSFYRVDTSLARIASGAGLGLAICRGLVQAHGGEIWAEPQPKGACIAFSIPTKKLNL